jgi:hypothetical protein
LGEDGELDARMLPLHGAGENRDHGKRGGDDAQHEPSHQLALLRADGAKLLLEGLPVVENEMRPLQHPLAFRGEADVALAALDDGDAQFLLQLADPSRERGLRDVAGLGGAGEVLLAGECREILKLADVHVPR